MRLICPNCGAQYDVPAEVIPESGRDVQCSNCGHTWFQRHPDRDADLAEDLNQPVPDAEWTPEDEPAEATSSIPPAERPDLSRKAAEPQTYDDFEEDDAEAEPEPVLPAEEAKPRGLDPEVAEIFREERDYESRRRAAESLETQPDLGLEEPDEDERARRSRQARERMARIRGDEGAAPKTARRPAPPVVPESAPYDRDEGRATAEAAAAAAASSRRDLLPNVDEINQTLRSTSEPRVIDSAERRSSAVEQKSGGFGKGFLLVIVLAALAIGTYANATKISMSVPQVAPALEAYVTAVDKGRVWLDAQVMRLMTTLDGMSSEADTPATEAPAEPEADTATDAPESN
ncbi:MAG: zinc-ribbon domain-containing protein [Sagittula sp.]|uniref:zinc-ribbon domain-containing protein n=1 Tax=Sagittula sp. TaxID=2038081 RepID=UPI00405990CA